MKLRHHACVLLFAQLACNLYEGRSLDLFPQTTEVLVECREAKDCPPDRRNCARGSCVQCLVDLDCDRRHPACVGNACVECRTEQDCAAGQACNSPLNACAPACSETSDCTGPATPYCSSELGVCLQCATNSDCRTPKNSMCGIGGRCVSCQDAGSCTLDAGAPVPPGMADPVSPPDKMMSMPTPIAPAPTPPSP